MNTSLTLWNKLSSYPLNTCWNQPSTTSLEPLNTIFHYTGGKLKMANIVFAIPAMFFCDVNSVMFGFSSIFLCVVSDIAIIDLAIAVIWP